MMPLNFPSYPRMRFFAAVLSDLFGDVDQFLRLFQAVLA